MSKTADESAGKLAGQLSSSLDSFPAILARAGQEKYGHLLNFKIGYTASKGCHLIVCCKVLPLASTSRLYLLHATRKISMAGKRAITECQART